MVKKYSSIKDLFQHYSSSIFHYFSFVLVFSNYHYERDVNQKQVSATDLFYSKILLVLQQNLEIKMWKTYHQDIHQYESRSFVNSIHC